jgi:hypothetical protein
MLIPALLEGTNCVQKCWQRDIVDPCTPYPHVLTYERLCADWIHRSAYDFVFPSDGSPSLLDLSDLEAHISRRRFCQGVIRYFHVAPSSEFKEDARSLETWTSTRFRLMLVSRLYRDLLRHDPNAAHQMADELFEAILDLDPNELNGSLLRDFYGHDKMHYPSSMALLEFSHSDGFGGRALSQVEQLISGHTANAILNPCPASLMLNWCFWSGLSEDQLVMWRQCIHSLVAAISKNFGPGAGPKVKVHEPYRSFIAWEGDRISFDSWRLSVSCRALPGQPCTLDAMYCSGIYYLLGRICCEWFDGAEKYLRLENRPGLRDSALEKTFSGRLEGGEETICDASTRLREIAQTFDMAMDLQLYDPMPRRKRLVFQATLELWLAWRKGQLRSEKFCDDRIATGGLRVVCHLWSIPGDQRFVEGRCIVLELEGETFNAVLQHTHRCVDLSGDIVSSNICGTGIQLSQLQKQILDDVRANEIGLSATEQLPVLACLRMELSSCFHEIEADEGDASSGDDYEVKWDYLTEPMTLRRRRKVQIETVEVTY